MITHIVNTIVSLTTFITEKRKILISAFFMLGMFCSTFALTIFLQRPQVYLSKAANTEVIVKNLFEEVLPVNEEGLPISQSLDVIVALNPKEIPQYYKIAETSVALDTVQPIPYERPP